MSFIQDKIKKMNPKHVTLLILVFPLVLAALFVNLVYVPKNAAIKSLEAKVQANESEIAKSQVMQRKLKELKAANEKLQQDLRAATERLPAPGEDAALPETVSSLATEAGLKVKSVTPGERKPGPGGLYMQTAIAVELSGGYHKFGKFMEKLDSMPRMLTVSGLDMSSAKLSGMEMDIPVKFTVLAFTAGGGK